MEKGGAVTSGSSSQYTLKTWAAGQPLSVPSQLVEKVQQMLGFFSCIYSGRIPRSSDLQFDPWTPDTYIWSPLCAPCGRDSIRRCAWVLPGWYWQSPDLDWVWFSCSPPLSLSWLYHTAWQSIFLWRGYVTANFYISEKEPWSGILHTASRLFVYRFCCASLLSHRKLVFANWT